MKITVFIVAFTIVSTAYAEPEFVKNHFVGRPFSEMNKEFHGAAQAESCQEKVGRDCSAKYGKKCDCKRVYLTVQQALKRDIYATVVDGKVVYFSKVIADATRLPLSIVYESVRNFFGDDRPTEVYAFEPGRETQDFYLKWKIDEGFAWAMAKCPLESVAGKKKVTSRLRDCFYDVAVIGRFIDPKTPKNAVKSDLAY